LSATLAQSAEQALRKR